MHRARLVSRSAVSYTHLDSRKLIDEYAKRDIVGIAFTVAAVVLFIAAVMRSDAIVTSFVSSALHLTLGIGAYIPVSYTHLEPVEGKRYMHQYNFPPYCTGEVGRMGSPKRREIGHGALAERALLPVIPSEDEFPYAIRVVSEIMESNGSSSMASTCGSTLALMDAGVPIKAPVSGIAMGLIKEGDDVVILSDIQGLEDFLGDMDFKVCGTSKGITALQMDLSLIHI